MSISEFAKTVEVVSEEILDHNLSLIKDDDIHGVKFLSPFERDFKFMDWL
jgi:hypothetical protein